MSVRKKAIVPEGNAWEKYDFLGLIDLLTFEPSCNKLFITHVHKQCKLKLNSKEKWYDNHTSLYLHFYTVLYKIVTQEEFKILSINWAKILKNVYTLLYTNPPSLPQYYRGENNRIYFQIRAPIGITCNTYEYYISI